MNSKDDADALAVANDTLYGLGAGVWSRNGTCAYRCGRDIQAGIGRENHRLMLDHYPQTKNMLVSYSPKALGFC
jgi:aldehyde dehydrogenase